jgi:hypothetical protein
MIDVIKAFDERVKVLNENTGYLVAHNIVRLPVHSNNQNFDLKAMKNEYAINAQSFDAIQSSQKFDTIAPKYLRRLVKEDPEISLPDFRGKTLGFLFGLLCADHPRYQERVAHAHDALADSVFFLILTTRTCVV